jgi:hypothetical protein
MLLVMTFDHETGVPSIITSPFASVLFENPVLAAAMNAFRTVAPDVLPTWITPLALLVPRPSIDQLIRPVSVTNGLRAFADDATVAAVEVVTAGCVIELDNGFVLGRETEAGAVPGPVAFFAEGVGTETGV